jgi:hypothetical protein
MQPYGKKSNNPDQFNRSAVMAVGTPKRSAQEVIHSARKYVKVGNPYSGFE